MTDSESERIRREHNGLDGLDTRDGTRYSVSERESGGAGDSRTRTHDAEWHARLSAELADRRRAAGLAPMSAESIERAVQAEHGCGGGDSESAEHEHYAYGMDPRVCAECGETF